MNFQDIRNEIDKERKEKPKLRILTYWALFSFFGIAIIKMVIRPKHYHLSETLTFLQGTLPNFFAGAIFFVLAFLNYRFLHINKESFLSRLIFAFLFSFLGLTLWEYLQYLIWRYPIDYFDILMTAIGNIITIILIFLLRIR